MDPKTRDEISSKEDADSGLDNTSESGHSGDEDAAATSSDYEDLLNSDNEGKTNNKKAGDKSVSVSSLGNTLGPDILFKSPDSESASREKTDILDFKIELNNNAKAIEEEYKEEIAFYKNLIEGQCETVDFSISSSSKKPEWLDEEKFKRGQRFARDHLFCINFAEMLSLFILFAQKSSLGPLIFTGKSDSPFTAFKRYLNTLTKLMSWYQDDIWNESDCSGNRNLITVRGMHKCVYQKLTSSSEEDVATKCTLGDPNTTALWCPMRDVLVSDFRESLPTMHEDLEQHLSGRKVWVNQADMSLTQFGFVGLAVTYPEYFGIHSASDDDLEAFLHLWRGLGYLLGIKDEYNYCNGDLNAVRKRTVFFLEAMAKPAFREVTYDWEHMCRCLTAGIAYYLPMVNFESALLYLCDILKINTPSMRKEMSFRSYLVYQIHRMTFYLMKFSGVLQWLNSKLYEVIKKVQNAPPEVLSKWESKEFSYMAQRGKRPIRSSIAIQDL